MFQKESALEICNHHYYIINVPIFMKMFKYIGSELSKYMRVLNVVAVVVF